jgi:hypothetical protein
MVQVLVVLLHSWKSSGVIPDDEVGCQRISVVLLRAAKQALGYRKMELVFCFSLTILPYTLISDD